jgi:putative flavoprotein involved in K+ transport
MGGAALARLATVPLPITDDGARRWSPGLYFCGVHLLRTRGSSLLFGVGEDAAVVARAVARHSR